MLHCIHFASSSPMFVEARRPEGQVSSRVDEPASPEQRQQLVKLIPTRKAGPGVRAPPATEVLPLEQSRVDRKLYRYIWDHCA